MTKATSFWCLCCGFFGMIVGVLLAVLSIYSVEKNESKGVFADSGVGRETEQGKKPEIGREIFAYLGKLAQDQNQKQEYLKVVEKLTRIVEDEAKKNPPAYSSHIEEMVGLVPKAGPGVAIQLEEYASAAVQAKMKQLREDANVAKLIELEKELSLAKKEIKDVRDKEELFSKAVSVLLRGWNDSIAKMKITNTRTKEAKEFSVGMDVFAEAYLEPGEYSVEFTSEQFSSVKLMSMFVVLPEAKYEYLGKRYHALIVAPGAKPNTR
jgi:hypothetical protein